MRLPVSVITLAEADLERSVRFYRDGLRLPTDGIGVPSSSVAR